MSIDSIDRISYINNVISTHCRELGITATPIPEPAWTPAENARGWADLRPGGPQVGVEPPIEFQYTPDVIAATTANLAPSFDGAGHPFLTLPGYLEIILDIVDAQVILMEEVGGVAVALTEEQRQAAIDAAGEDLGWESLATLFAAQSSRVDAMVGVRSDLVGDPGWAGTDVDTGFGLRGNS